MGTVTITITSRNDAPVADPAFGVSSPEDAILAIDGLDVLAKATPGGITAIDERNQTLSISLPGMATSQGGTVSFSAVNNQFTYTPPTDFNRNFPAAVDTFVYQLTDDGYSNGIFDPQSSFGTVTVTLTEVNDAPQPSEDSFNGVVEETPIAIPAVDLVANDAPGPATATDEIGQVLTVISVMGPTGTLATANGSVFLGFGGNIVYTPNTDFFGVDTFYYLVRDNGVTNGIFSPAVATGTVHVTVANTNDAPLAVDDHLAGPTVVEDAIQTIGFASLTANDSAGTNEDAVQTLTVSLYEASSAFGGQVQLAPSGNAFVYTPPANFNQLDGIDWFRYSVADDGAPNLSTTGTVFITLAEQNDVPVPTNDLVTAGPMEDTLFSVSVATLLANDTAGPGNEFAQSLSIIGNPTPVTIGGGSLAFDGSSITYTPAPNFNGPFIFTYTVQDNGQTNGVDDYQSAIGQVTLMVAPINDRPTVVTDGVMAREDEVATLTITNLLSNDSPGPGDEAASQSLSFVGVLNASGSAVVNAGPTSQGGIVTVAGGEVRYTPPANFFGTDTFRYVVVDSAAFPAFGTGTVSITVAEINDAPVAVRDTKAA
ncbi:MAG: tandem-95 repeat protein, partial [Planctomycetales bacterium]|nr:tandem-95 repeat protein [Planctomycetales bacterium]